MPGIPRDALLDELSDLADRINETPTRTQMDDHGREPLFAGPQGRLSFSTQRAWSSQTTQPYLWTNRLMTGYRPLSSATRTEADG